MHGITYYYNRIAVQCAQSISLTPTDYTSAFDKMPNRCTFFFSFMCLHSQRRRRLRRVLPLRLRTIVERSSRQLRCSHSRCAGRSYHRSTGVEKLRAKAPRAADMVVRARSVRYLYTVCGRVQREPSLLRRPTHLHTVHQ